MKKAFPIITVLVSMMLTPVYAEEPWTEFGVYIFATEISGEAELGNITADVDVSFNEILEHLDIGFMGYFEHRRDKWSFIGDIAYLRISDDNSHTEGRLLEIDLEAGLTQTVIEGFGGYRFFEQAFEDSKLGVDFIFGARHTTLEIEIDLDLGLGVPPPGFSVSGSREREEDWIDAVVGARFQSDYRNGWGSTIWLDLGEGSDSSSYQALALVNYGSGDSDWKFYGGYRLLHLEYDAGSDSSHFAVDLDYSGPMFGASYRI